MSIRPRSIGEVLDGAVRLYRQDIGLYMFTAIVASLPLAFVMILSLTGSSSAVVSAGSILLALVALVATTVVWTAIMVQMNERLEGREPQLGPSISRALALVLRVAWGAILAYIGILGVFVVCGIAIVVVGVAAGLALPPVVTSSLMGVTGIGLFIFLGIYVFAGLALFLPGIVVEGLTAYKAIKRGFDLVKGGQFRVFAIVMLSWILIFVPLMAVYFVTGTASMLMDPEAVSSGVVSMTQVVLQQLLSIIASGFTTPFMVACVLLVYYDQRIRREAYDLQAEADALAP